MNSNLKLEPWLRLESLACQCHCAMMMARCGDHYHHSGHNGDDREPGSDSDAAAPAARLSTSSTEASHVTE